MSDIFFAHDSAEIFEHRIADILLRDRADRLAARLERHLLDCEPECSRSLPGCIEGLADEARDQDLGRRRRAGTGGQLDEDERGKAETSIMPGGLADTLSTHELASILAIVGTKNRGET